MDYQYVESFDITMNTYRRIYSLDGIRLFFLSEFSNKKRKVLRYSIDVEKAYDSHYEIDAKNAIKLKHLLHCSMDTNDLVSALAFYFSKNSENDFVKMLEDAKISFQPYHFDDYDLIM